LSEPQTPKTEEKFTSMQFTMDRPTYPEEGEVEVAVARSPWFWFGLGFGCILCTGIIVVQCVIISKNMKQDKFAALKN
jgi:hypothetical protein